MSQQNTSNSFSYDAQAISQELCVRSEVLTRLVVSFSDTIVQKISVLEGAFVDNDILKMRATLHEIRGTSGNLRLNSILSSAKVMHEAVKAGEDQSKVSQYFDALKSCVDEFCAYAQKNMKS